ncbi:gamma-glutamyl hydrolase-like [Boleophthalmus pectinirostris]|uniref:gamma-glutamyl hydrolase-like n=1 Tax=Boleophthalmus pectinirostris TaxID=150288 RepID=UPI000A1C434D|nr:gamma-glutamyl hydrolase-like [Boleophthalmus pectinirostris]
MEVKSTPELNHTPVIGVLAQNFNKPIPKRISSNPNRSYIVVSYVKYLEAAGAKVVPIHINKTEDEYRALFMSINGLLIPGGKKNMLTSHFARTARLFLELAKEANDQGDYFPVWGTCLGFLLMVTVAIGDRVLTATHTKAMALPLTFTEEAKESRMLKSIPKDTLQALASEPLTAHNHTYSVDMDTYRKFESLNSFYRVLTTNTTDEGIKFFSTIEAYKYPFYASIWHPEKSQFERTKSSEAHSPSAVKAAQHLGDFFINEARKSRHSFNSDEEEKKALINQYTPTDTADWTIWKEIYFF